MKLHSPRGDPVHRGASHPFPLEERADALGLEPAAGDRGREAIGKYFYGNPRDQVIRFARLESFRGTGFEKNIVFRAWNVNRQPPVRLADRAIPLRYERLAAVRA